MVNAGAGGTFLDWSIHFLSSRNLIKDYIEQKTFTSIHKCQIPFNPLRATATSVTAHLHCKTHPHNIDEFTAVWDLYSSDGYEHDVFTSYTANDMSDSGLYREIILKFPNIFKNIIFRYSPKHVDSIFMWQYDRMEFKDSLPFDDSKFSHSDLREKLSLFYPQMVKEQLESSDIGIDDVTNIYEIDFDIFINSLDEIMIDILSECGVSIIPDRYEHWLNVYREWQNSLGIEFINHIDEIIKNIIENTYHDLSTYNMSFGKEVVLCKKLLFEHNLSLRDYGVEIMPLNAKSWYSMLEKNTYHDLGLSGYNSINS
jgi:hypothetical protein